jgi:hypothetical protein
MLCCLLALNYIVHGQETFVASFKGETAITIKPGNSKVIVGASNDYAGTFFRSASHTTTTGGYTSADWTTVQLVLPSGKTDSADPTVDYDASGNVYYCCTAYDTETGEPTLGGVYVYKSTNNGQSWQTPITVHLPGSGQHDDKPWMAVDRVRNPNRVYVAWTRRNSNGTQDLLFSYAPTNNLTTNTFASNLEVLRLGSVSGNFVFINRGAAIAVGQSGSTPPLYVSCVEEKYKADVPQKNSSSIFVYKSTNGGDTFTITPTVKSNFNSASTHNDFGSLRFFSFPTLAISPTTNNVHIAWCEYVGSSNLTVFYKRSTNAGGSWSNEGTVTPPIAGTQQFSPFLSTNASGRIFVTFYNIRFTTYECWFYSQVSTDVGASFGGSYSHTTVSSNPLNGYNVTDYVGAIAPADNPLPTAMWMDFRNGTPTSLRGDAFFDQKLHLASNVSTATAGNGQRKLAKSSTTNTYHLVYEANGEVWYTKSTDGGTTWSAEKLISERSGTNSSPCIVERGGKIYVVWQKLNGSSYNVYFHKSTDGGATWPDANRQTLASSVGSNPPLPVIISPATSTITGVYRTGTNLSYRVSTNDGSSWATAAAVPSTGANDNSPTLAPTVTYWGSTRSALVYANTSSVIYYRYYKNGPDSTGWNASAKNLSSIVPGSYNSHKKPSIAPSGTSGDYRLHTVWEARSGTSGYYYVIIHRKATDWGTWPNVYSATYYEYQQQPSITGLHDGTAELLFKYYTQNLLYKMHYDGSAWNSAPVFVGTGTNPSVSVGNTSAKYVWTDGTASPYQIKISTETLSKVNSLTAAYHRSVAVIDSTTSAWLEVRLDKLSVKTKSGSEFAIPFENAKEDDATLTPANAFINLSAPPVVLPADAESLLVNCQISAQDLSAIKNASSTVVADIILSGKDGTTLGLPILRATPENLAEDKLVLRAPISTFAGSELRPAYTSFWNSH